MLAIVLALAAATTAEVDPKAYPELAAEVLLPPILNELKNTLADPYSVRDFTLCPARAIKLKDGKPTGWQVSIAFNSKNSFGGYTGRKTYSVLFRDGIIRGGLFATQFATSGGLEGLMNSMTMRQMASCPQVPDAQIQKLMSGEASNLKTVP